MATTFKWATAESAVSAMTTTLNALPDAAYAGVSSTITNSTDLYENIALELNLAALSPAAGAYVEIWILYAIDASNFATTGKPLITSALLTTFQLDTTASTAQRLYKAGLGIAPHDFKLDLRNKAGVSLGATGNTLKYSRYNDQGV
jgi:hypothetical protein